MKFYCCCCCLNIATHSQSVSVGHYNPKMESSNVFRPSHEMDQVFSIGPEQVCNFFLTELRLCLRLGKFGLLRRNELFKVT